MEKDINNIELTKEEEARGYKVIATKVHPLAAKQIQRICDRVGIKPYKLLQHVIACMMRMMGEATVLEDNSQLRELISLFFSEIKDFKKRYNIADPVSKKEITDSLFFLGDSKHSIGRQSVLVTPMQKGKDGIEFPPFENWNIAQQLEFFLQNADPHLYKRIRQAGARFGVENSYEILCRIAQEYTDRDTMAEEIAELFQDNDRSDYGVKQTNQPYKRHHKRDINTIKFADEDKAQAEEEATDGCYSNEPTDFRPFGAEW